MGPTACPIGPLFILLIGNALPIGMIRWARNGGPANIVYVTGGRGQVVGLRGLKATVMSVRTTMSHLMTERSTAAPPRGPSGASRSAVSTPTLPCSTVAATPARIPLMVIVSPPLIVSGVPVT